MVYITGIMSSTTIRVGIVGAGKNTVDMHIPGLQQIDDVNIVRVCNRRRESSERVAGAFGIPHIDDDWRALVASEDTDAIVIGTWPYLHCPIVLAALAADKHVMTEARMAMNLAEARRMHDASRARPDLVAQIVPSPMTLWADETIRRLIAEGYVGDVLSVEIRDGGAFLDRDGPLHWRQDVELSGSNIMSVGIWYEAMMRWVGVATRVAALGKIFTTMRRDPESGRMVAVRVPEHIDIVMDLACGAQGHIVVSTVQGLAAGSGVGIYGSEGTLRIQGSTLYGGRRGDAELQEIPIPDGEQGAWRVEEEFVNAIRGREKITHTTFDAGVRYMAFTDAVNRSMAAGRAMVVPP